MTTTLHHPSFQPYFVAFAASRGVRPEDIEPGVPTNIAFVEWIDAQWKGFGFGPNDPRTEADRAAFLAWLTERAVVVS